MKFLNKAKFFIAGVITTILITTTITAYTSSIKKTITVDYNNIKLSIDGKIIEPVDGYGKRVDPFIHDGTTYLPVRAISQALGKSVTWDGSTNTVKITSEQIAKTNATLDMWIMPNSQNAIDDLMEVARPYLSENSNIKLNVTLVDWGSAWTKTTAAATSSSAPDILQLGTTWVGAITDMNALADLTGKINETDFLPQTMEYSKMTGSSMITAVPWFADTRALFYRKDACKKAGVDPNKDFATWDSFKAALKKLNNVEINGKKLSALGMPGRNDWNVVHNFAPWIYSAGGSFVNSDFTKGTLDSQETYNGVKFYSELAAEGLINKQALQSHTGDIESAFINGDYATSIIGPWNIDTLEANKTYNGNNLVDNVGVALLPSGPKGRFGFLGGSNLAVFDSSKNKTEAIRFINFLTGKNAQIEYCKKTGNLPVVKDAYNDPWITEHSMRKVFKEQINYAVAYPALPEWGPLETYAMMGLSEVWDNATGINGKYSASKTMDALKKANKELTKILSEY